jgi:hypothetical protein
MDHKYKKFTIWKLLGVFVRLEIIEDVPESGLGMNELAAIS